MLWLVASWVSMTVCSMCLHALNLLKLFALQTSFFVRSIIVSCIYKLSCRAKMTIIIIIIIIIITIIDSAFT